MVWLFAVLGFMQEWTGNGTPARLSVAMHANRSLRCDIVLPRSNPQDSRN